MKKLIAIAALVAAGVGGAVAFSQEPAAKIRIGTYDNRAIAVAYAASKFYAAAIAEKRAELERAKAAGDEAAAKALHQWGEEHQRAFHIQGFGQAVVSDMLKPIAKEIAELATRVNVVAIARDCDFHAEGVELVDVTDELVALYDPSEVTLRSVKAVRQAEPVPLGQLAAMDVDK